MEMETDIEAIQPQAKECLEPPEVGRSKGFFLRSFRVNMVMPNLDF